MTKVIPATRAIGRLEVGTCSDAEVSGQLQYFAKRISVTFIDAGGDVERIGLFSGTAMACRTY